MLLNVKFKTVCVLQVERACLSVCEFFFQCGAHVRQKVQKSEIEMTHQETVGADTGAVSPEVAICRLTSFLSSLADLALLSN